MEQQLTSCLAQMISFDSHKWHINVQLFHLVVCLRHQQIGKEISEIIELFRKVTFQVTQHQADYLTA